MVSKKYQYVLVQLSYPHFVSDTVFKVDHEAWQKEENVELQINYNRHGTQTKQHRLSALLSDERYPVSALALVTLNGLKFTSKYKLFPKHLK